MSAETLHCPTCGRTLEAAGQTRRCAAGGMVLSLYVNRALEADFGVGSAPQPQPRRWPLLGGVWFCPADATQMVESDGVVVCPHCGRSLAHGTLWQLIELHMHAPIG